MTGVNEDNLVILVDTVLVNPVRVQNSEVTTTPANALFRNTSQSSLGLEVVHALMHGFTISGTYEVRQHKSVIQVLLNTDP